jgi:hypothetical protein
VYFSGGESRLGNCRVHLMGFFPPGTYDLFLTHAWRYTDEWQGLVALLDEYLPGKWRNWSLPWHDTSIDRFSDEGRAQLEKLLRGHITQASGVILLPETRERAEGRLWLEKQLALATQYKKPVIGVLPQSGVPFPDELVVHVSAIVPRDASMIIATLDRLLQEKARAS